MIRILTESKDEYEKIKSVLKDHMEGPKKYNPYIEIIKPNDCKAVVMLSVGDVESYFPDGTTVDIIERGLTKIEKKLKNDMIDRIWDTIHTLKKELLSVLSEEEGEY